VWRTRNETADFVAKKYNISREALDHDAGTRADKTLEGFADDQCQWRGDCPGPSLGVCAAGEMATAAYLERA
jgi:hypothetical protein